jgi:hypothetical protein
MTKAIVQFGYGSYVLDAQAALKLTELLAEAEIYEEKWRKVEEGGMTHHIYPQDTSESMRVIKIVPNALYQIAKMAGRPE